MAYKRTGYAPWSLTREAGVQSATVDGTIEVPQYITPTLDTGFIDKTGNWKGRKSSDEDFIALTKAEAIADGTNALFPDTPDFPSLNMDGYTMLQIAIRVTSTGNYAFFSITGPDTVGFKNLSNNTAGATIRITDPNTAAFETALDDAESVGTAGSWFLFTVMNNRLANQPNLQIRITNNSGGVSDMEVAFRRLL